VLVTANPSFQVGELRYVLEQSGSVALFHVASHRGNPMAAIAREVCEGLERVRVVVDIDADDQLFAVGGRPAELPVVEPRSAAQIQYTSGTTGFPKGAVLSHHNLVNNAGLFAERALINRDSVCANFMPLFHTAGCASGALGSLHAGCRMLLIEQFDADALAMRIETERVTNFFAVPTMLVALLESLEQRPRNIESLVAITTGGAPVSPELVERVRSRLGCHLLTAFGQTEASPMITVNHTDVSADHIASSAGQPLPLTEVSIRTAREDGAAGVATSVVPIGAVGEICTRGYGVMIGYNDNPEATAAAIDDEGWLHTGDLGTLDEQGFLRITGRVKDMIIRGGENHFPAEIENALLEHPTVAEVAVVGLPDPKWGEVIGAFVRTVGDEPIDVDGLRAHCREVLSPQKTPSVWEQLKEFPLTGSGKIQKFAIRDGYVNRSVTEGDGR
jgi:fatty-acyl-CoA synthase